MRPASEPIGSVIADAATGGKYLPFPGTWWQLMIPLWQINVLVLQIKHLKKLDQWPVPFLIQNQIMTPRPLTTQDWQPEQQGQLKTSELFESGNYSKAVMSYFSQQFLIPPVWE